MIYNPVNPSQQLTPKQGPWDQSPREQQITHLMGRGGGGGERLPHGRGVSTLGAAAVEMKALFELSHVTVFVLIPISGGTSKGGLEQMLRGMFSSAGLWHKCLS